jgi:tetratricopeptide (TPR) repeat protein
MINSLKHRLPDLEGPILNHLIFWAGTLLVISIVAFAAYYYFDQRGSAPSNQEVLQVQLSQYEQVVRDDPNNITNRLALADVYLALDRYDDAIPQYEAALVINDQSVLGQVGLGRAKLGAGDLSGASESFQKVIDQSKEADISGELVQSAYYYLGSIALEQQKPDEAIEHLKLATSIERSDSDAWYLLGTAYRQGGKLDEAVDALAQAVLFVPDFTEAYEQLALVYDEKGASGEALYARGMVAYSTGKLDEAAKQLQAATRASPTLAEAFAGLGLVREVQGQGDAAMVAYQQALHLNPDNFNARTGLARLGQPEAAASPEAELPAGHPGGQADGGSEQGVTP